MKVGPSVRMNFCLATIAGLIAWLPAVAYEGLADPTRPSAAGDVVESYEPQNAGPVLQSTMVAPGSKRAVISGKTYTVGEHLGAAVIVDIRPYEVILDQGGRETRLRLVPSLVKENVKGKNP